MQTQYRSLYALAFINVDPWFTATYDSDFKEVITPRAASRQYKALEALSRFAKEHPQEVDAHTTRCDVLKQFEKLAE